MIPPLDLERIVTTKRQNTAPITDRERSVSPQTPTIPNVITPPPPPPPSKLQRSDNSSNLERLNNNTNVNVIGSDKRTPYHMQRE